MVNGVTRTFIQCNSQSALQESEIFQQYLRVIGKPGKGHPMTSEVTTVPVVLKVGEKRKYLHN